MDKAALIRVVLLMFLVCSQNAGALGINITGKTAEAYYRCEYNRSFGYIGEASAVGALDLDSVYALRAGFSYGRIAGDSDIKAFAGAGAALFSSLPPLAFRASWIYNGLPGYETRSHTILPVVSYGAHRAGISAGSSLRFTSFFGEPSIFEAVLAFSLYLNFVNGEALRIGVSCENFSDFYAGSMGAYSLKLVSGVRVGGNWRIINDFEVMQSGGDGLSSVLYGIAWRGGIKFSW